MKEIEINNCLVSECSPLDYEQLTIETTFLHGRGFELSFFTLDQDLGPNDVYIEFRLGKEPWKMRLDDFKTILQIAESQLLDADEYLDPAGF